MFSILLACSLLDAPKTRVVSAALFKNGYAVVMREVQVTAGETRIDEIPSSALGTLWIAGKNGLRVGQVVNEVVKTKSEENAGSIDELLAGNIGKAITLMRDNQPISGELISANGNVVLLKVGPGVVAINKSSVAWVEGFGLKPTVDRTKTTRALRIKTDAAGTVSLLSLERGATWAPSYLVDISNPSQLTIIGRATILNDLDDFENVPVSMITGFPNVPYAHIPDPLTSGWSVEQFVQMLGGGMRFDAGQMMQNQAMDRRAEESGAPPPEPETGQVGDLFMYTQPNVTLKKGERGVYTLFSVESPYAIIYTWEVEDSVQGLSYRGLPEGPGDVWTTLKFKNTAPLPLTTAPATTYKDGHILGQDLAKYTSVGAEALLKVTKALEIRADVSEVELSRVQNPVRPRLGDSVTVTLRGSLDISNRKDHAVHMRITKNLTGEVLSADENPKIDKPAVGLNDTNPRARLVWEVDIPARATKKISYTFKVVVQ